MKVISDHYRGLLGFRMLPKFYLLLGYSCVFGPRTCVIRPAFLCFRAKGPAIYLAQPAGLGGGSKVKAFSGPKARSFALLKRTQPPNGRAGGPIFSFEDVGPGRAGGSM